MRILFLFDPEREAIPQAEARYDECLADARRTGEDGDVPVSGHSSA
ncbi:hypothetical protein [Streptomyces sp. NPDC004629]